MVPFHLLGQEAQKDMPHDNFGHMMQWHQYHVMSIASSMATLHFCQDNQNEVKYIFGSCNAFVAGVSVT